MKIINPKVMYNSDASLVLSLPSIQFNIEYINRTIILNEPNELLEQWVNENTYFIKLWFIITFILFNVISGSRKMFVVYNHFGKVSLLRWDINYVKNTFMKTEWCKMVLGTRFIGCYIRLVGMFWKSPETSGGCVPYHKET